MLGDDHDAVDGKLARAEGECLADGWEALQAVALDPLPAEIGLFFFSIPLRKLRDVNRRHVEPRLLPAPLPGIAAAEPVEDVLGVGVLEDHRAEDGDLFSSARGDGVRRHERARSGDGGHEPRRTGSEEITAGDSRRQQLTHAAPRGVRL